MSNSKPWQTPEILNLRANHSPVVEAFLAFLEAEAEAAARPVPPTQNNWLVLRAWADGQTDAYERIRLFFDPKTVQHEIEMLAKSAERAERQRKPLGDDPFKLA